MESGHLSPKARRPVAFPFREMVEAWSRQGPVLAAYHLRAVCQLLTAAGVLGQGECQSVVGVGLDSAPAACERQRSPFPRYRAAARFGIGVVYLAALLPHEHIEDGLCNALFVVLDGLLTQNGRISETCLPHLLCDLAESCSSIDSPVLNGGTDDDGKAQKGQCSDDCSLHNCYDSIKLHML